MNLSNKELDMLSGALAPIVHKEFLELRAKIEEAKKESGEVPVKDLQMCPECGYVGDVVDENDNGGSIDELNVKLECECGYKWAEHWNAEWSLHSWNPGEDWPEVASF
jgi:hypothetical protein